MAYMNQLNFNKLYYFYVVAKEGSIKAASKKLHVTQPTISTQLKDFEDSIGYQLFERKHRKLELNARGQTLLKKAENLFRMSENILDSLSTENAPREHINIGALQSLSNSFISDFSLGMWRDTSILTRVSQGHLKDLVDSMNEGNLDILLSDGPFKQSSRYHSLLLNSDKIIAVAHPKLQNLKRNFPKSLSGMPYVAYSNDGYIQSEIDHFFIRNNIRPDRIGEVDDVTLMRVITMQTKCFSIMSAQSAKESIKQKEVVKIGEFKGIKSSIWAMTPTISSNRKLINKVLKAYFKK